MSSHWYQAIERCHRQGKAYVLLTQLASAGSTPRSAGSKMVVTEDSIFDTIGGGHLEHKAIARARELLSSSQHCQHIEHYPLASKLGQCCGGTTNVLFEVFKEHVQRLYLFGAGHVAKTLIPIISQLPLQIVWCDNRSNMYTDTCVADNVTIIEDDEPGRFLHDPPAQSWVLIMTHDHQLDFELTCAAITCPAVHYVGMIGSHTKARRFLTRLDHQGMTDNAMQKFVCPVGLSAVPGKKPIEVSVSIAAQLIQMLNTEKQDNHGKSSWRKTKEIAKLL